MLLFWFFVLVCCAVKCDCVSNNYYVIEMPEVDIARDFNTPFEVYWNVPTKQCKSKKVPFDNLEKFNIIQNNNDSFGGERITIMYDPGVFPAIFKGDSGKYRYRNGGVPQEGNLEEHLNAFRKNIDESIPNPNFSGIGVIDFESWRPIFRQQFGKLKPYIDLSLNIEKERHWWWPASWQRMEATKRFEDASRIFMQTTLSIAQQMRPKALWGYYAYPYCFNMGTNNMVENCSSVTKRENDKVYWLWAQSTALYPSVYISSELSSAQLGALVRGRVTEANRLKKVDTPVLPYFWYKYRDGGFISKEDVNTIFEALRKTNASGLIIWGSSNDVNEVEKCKQLYNYVENILGPVVKKNVQIINKMYEEPTLLNPEDYSDNFISGSDVTTTIATTLKEREELNTAVFENTGTDYFVTRYFRNIETVDLLHNEQLKKDNKTEDNQTNLKSLNDSSIWNIITTKMNTENDDTFTTISSNHIENIENLKDNETELHLIKATNETTPNNNNSIVSSTTEIILPQKRPNDDKEEVDDFLITIENTTNPNIEMPTNATEKIHFDSQNDDLIIIAINLATPVNTSGFNNLNTFNDSNEMTIVNIQLNTENESTYNTTSTKSVENIETLISNDTELQNNITTSKETTSNDKEPLNIDVSTTEMTLPEKSLFDDNEDEVDDFLIIIDNTTYPNIEMSTDTNRNLVYDDSNDDLIILATNTTNYVNTSGINIGHNLETLEQSTTTSTENVISNTDIATNST